MKKISKIIDSIFDWMDGFLKKIMSYRLIYYILGCVGLFVLYYFNMKEKVRVNLVSSEYNNKYIVFGSIVTIICVVLCIIIKKVKKIEIHKLFIMLSLTLGSLYIFCIPMFAQSDEPSHYLKAYSVAMGKLGVNSKYNNTFVYPELVKKSIYYNTDSVKWREHKTYDDNKAIRNMKPNYEEGKFVTLREMAANYSFINYIPHVIGMKIGMVLKFNSYYIGLFGRIMNLIICTFLLALGLKWLPYKKNAAAVFLLSPVVISYNAAISIDGALLCYTFLFISYILKLRYEKQILNKKSILFLLLLVVLISITKIAYLPIIACVLLLPKECFREKNNFKKYMFSILVFILGIFSTITFLHMMNTNISSSGGYSNAWIYHSPVRLIYIFLNNTLTNGYDYIINIFAGHYLCHNQVKPYELISFCYIVFFMISIFSEEIKDKFRYVEKALMIIIMLIVYFMLFLAMYLANTPVNNAVAIGVQGRYFIPILILFILLFSKKKNSISEKTIMNIIILFNLSVLLTMIVRFMFFVY